MNIVNRPGIIRTGNAPKRLSIAATVIVAAMLVPVIYLIIRTIGVGSEIFELIWRQRTFEIVTNSILLMLAVSCASVLIAVPIGWLTTKTDLPFRRAFSVATVLPLVIPSYVGGFVLVIALGPKGILQGWLSNIGVERLPEIYGFPGAMLTLTLLTYPYVLLPVRSALQRLDPSLDEASHALGKGSYETFLRITLPMLRPSIAAGTILVALYTISDFGAVSLLHYETFTWAIYIQYGNFARDMAASLSLVLVAIAISLLIAETRTRGKARYYRNATGLPHPHKLIRLGRWKWPAMALCSSVVIFSLLIPISVLVYWVVRGLAAGEQISLPWDHIENTLFVAVAAALTTVIASIPIAMLSVRYPSYISTLLERLSYVGFALPGIVVALAMVFFGIRYAAPLYQTTTLLIFAYMVLFLPAALGNVRASLVQISPVIEQAARILGKSPSQVFTTITLPLLISGILAGSIMVFMLTMKELPATLILSPIGFQTLATSIWSATEDVFFAKAAAPALLMILLSSVPMGIIVWLGREEVS